MRSKKNEQFIVHSSSSFFLRTIYMKLSNSHVKICFYTHFFSIHTVYLFYEFLHIYIATQLALTTFYFFYTQFQKIKKAQKKSRKT
jgi:hypothetical protein